jgi:hypothetical protein
MNMISPSRTSHPLLSCSSRISEGIPRPDGPQNHYACSFLPILRRDQQQQTQTSKCSFRAIIGALIVDEGRRGQMRGDEDGYFGVDQPDPNYSCYKS